MILLIPFIYLVIVAIDAYTDTYRTVKHKRGLFLYALACIFISIVYLKFTDVNIGWLIGFSLFTRLAFFNPVYGLLRGVVNWFTYQGDLKKKDVSLFDKLEAWSGISIFWLRVAYIAKYISFLTIYFLYA